MSKTPALTISGGAVSSSGTPLCRFWTRRERLSWRNLSERADIVRTVPGANASRGDLYNVHRDATKERDSKPDPRRMVCVAELPDDTVWRAMARSTTAYVDGDLASPENAALGLTKSGWWSHRFIRSVKKRWTGDPTLCDFLATLPEPLRTEVLDHYKNRPRPKKS